MRFAINFSYLIMAVQEDGHATVSPMLALTRLEKFAILLDRKRTYAVPPWSIGRPPSGDDIN